MRVPLAPSFESVEKVDTLLDGNAVRSKIKDFRTALYPRQYHLSVLEKPLIKRLFAYKVFFRRTCRRKNKIRLTAAEKLNLRFIDRLKRGVTLAFTVLDFSLASLIQNDILL